MRVLVTDGENRAALAITRSLGAKGHYVVVGEKGQPSLAGVSRYCGRQIGYPDPVRDSSGFVESLRRSIRAERIDVVMPVAEITTGLVVEHRTAFEPVCRVPFPSVDAFNDAADKVRVMALARELGIPAPTGTVLHAKGDRPGRDQDLRFPVVVKPHRSRIRVQNAWRSTGVSYAETAESLEATLAEKNSAEYPVLVQERIVGPGMGVFLCYDRGRPVAAFSHARLREKPPSGGVSVLCESVPVDPRARVFATRLLNHLKWHGVAMVEFKVDQSDDTPKLMEINGRFWGSLQLAIDAGVDFPSMLLHVAMGDPVEPIESYRLGVKSRWLVGDADALLMRLFKRREALHLAEGQPGRLRALAEFVRFGGRDTRYDTWSGSDMKPGVHEVLRWMGLRH